MKRIRTHLIPLCVLALGLAAPLSHAGDDSEQPRVEKRPTPQGRDQSKDRLGLTEEQAQQMRTIRAEEREQMKALRAKDLPPKERREEMRKLRDATRAKMDAVLTEEQKAKRDALRKERPGPKRDKAPAEGKGHKGPPSAPAPEAEAEDAAAAE